MHFTAQVVTESICICPSAHDAPLVGAAAGRALQVVTSNMLRQRSKLSTSLDMLVRQSNRPKCASPCKEDDFCLVDESRVAHARCVCAEHCRASTPPMFQHCEPSIRQSFPPHV